MDIAEHIEHLRRDGARLVEAAGRAGLDAPVPTCPGWTVRDLVGKLLDWYRDAHSELVDALTKTDPGVACWSFLAAPSPLAFWARRQAHETAIHRVDAESAGSSVTPVAPGFAVDGIDELLNGFLSRPTSRLVADPPTSLAVRATDADAAWTVHIGPDGRRIVPREEPAELHIAGPASDLYLLLWNRRDTDGLGIDGDPAALDVWRAKATVAWR